MFPVFLNLTGRQCAVIGGGPVGRRKAAALLQAGALVRLVCLEARPPEQRAPGLDWFQEPYQARHLDGVSLVFAAATADVNQAVAADARHRAIWINVAHEPHLGDFFVPAAIHRGDFTLAISTGGAAPALARNVRSMLEYQFDVTFAEWVAVLGELRPLVLTRIADPDKRRTLLRQFCKWEWLDALRMEGRHAVRLAMEAEIQALAGDSADPV
jgi:precorrin-2 dehydrogenase/sirohydrochlorin ferrochelatase